VQTVFLKVEKHCAKLSKNSNFVNCNLNETRTKLDGCLFMQMTSKGSDLNMLFEKASILRPLWSWGTVRSFAVIQVETVEILYIFAHKNIFWNDRLLWLR